MEGVSPSRAVNIHSVTNKSDEEEDSAHQWTAPTNERLPFIGKNLWKPWQHARARIKGPETFKIEFAVFEFSSNPFLQLHYGQVF